MTRIGYLAVDQYGEKVTLRDVKKHPRGQLLNKLGFRHADKMYTDTKGGESKHIGYIVNRRWFTIYNVCEWEGGSHD